ncbi:TadE family protein [Xylanimonas ulmi]|nr:TadE family protein [Xylanibacterium ulmi]
MSTTRPPASGRRRWDWSDDRGSHSIEMVILLPVLFALMFVGVQAVLYYYARSIAGAAAQEGARVAAAYEATLAAGIASAATAVEEVGWDDAITDASITGTRDAEIATVVVTGHALSVIPGWSPTITQSASMPVERLVAP